MSIYLYSGVPGSGKSLHIANNLRYWLGRSHRPVVGNFELAPDAPVKHPEDYHYYPNQKLEPQKLIDIAEDYWSSHDFKEDYLVLVIDECQ